MKQCRADHLHTAFKRNLYWVEKDGSVWCAEKKCGFHTRPSHKMKTKYRTHKGAGYYIIQICVNNIKFYYPVHQVVWSYFHGTPVVGQEINHIDCDKTNNRISNLEITSRKGNAMHAYINNRMLKERCKVTGRILK